MPTLFKRNRFLAFSTLMCAIAVGPSQAEDAIIIEVRDLGHMKELVQAAMPPFLKDPGEVVQQLLNVPLAQTPLIRGFNQQSAVKQVFGDSPVSFDPDCRRRGTPAGEPDEGDCTVQNGREAGKGEYTQLSFSKNMGNGNLKFLKRAVVDDQMAPEKLPTAKLRDDQALEKALGFLKDLGLPTEELPLPPNGASSLVRSLALAGADEKGERTGPFVIQKVVTLPRGFKLSEPYKSPNTGQELTHVPGPGMAMVAVDDRGVVGAAIADWKDIVVDPKMTSDHAKTQDELVEEIAEDLFNDGLRHIAAINFLIQVGVDWRGTFGILLPAVQVSVNPVPRDPTEAQQEKFALMSTAGIVKQYSLVDMEEDNERN